METYIDGIEYAEIHFCNNPEEYRVPIWVLSHRSKLNSQ